MHFGLIGRPAVGTACLIVVLVGINYVQAVVSSANSMIIDTHWDRFRIQDVCSNENRNLRLYLDFGDHGWVHGSTVDESNALTTPVCVFCSLQLFGTASMYTKLPIIQEPMRFQHRKPRRNTVTTSSVMSSCTLELVTCPSCRFKVVASDINIANSGKCATMMQPDENIIVTDSAKAGDYNDHLGVCRCNYLAFSEPQFEAEVVRKRMCNGIKQPMEYVGYTRSVLMHFEFGVVASKDSFNVTFESERNLDVVIGIPIDEQELAKVSYQPGAVIGSPYFPTLCSRDLIKQHMLRCETADAIGSKKDDKECIIRILFTDFQIGMMSRMEFYNSVGHLIHMYSGDVFRPPVILEPGPSLLVRFYANGAADALRYRAEVDFLRPNRLGIDDDGIVQPVTECGGNVDTLGGAITMMNMVANDSRSVRYDCVWVIRPSRRYLNTKPNLSFRVSVFDGFASRSELIIREGQTSSHPKIDSLQWENTMQVDGSINKEFVVSTSTGFYVSFKGSFGISSKLALVYTVFDNEPKKSTGFVCKNLRCIPIQLQCDGFDQCGDGSDEQDSCTFAWTHDTSDRRWYSHTPNFYFPKTDRYPDLRAATIVFLVSSVGLILLIFGVIILLYRMGHWARESRELQGHLHTISELLDNQMDEEVIPTDLDPPAYEDPPDYEDVIKVGMDEFFATQVNCQRPKTTNICQQLLNAVSLGPINNDDDSAEVSSTIAFVVAPADVGIDSIVEAQPVESFEHLVAIESNDSVNPSSNDTTLPTDVEPTVLVHDIESNPSVWSFFNEPIMCTDPTSILVDDLAIPAANIECLVPEILMEQPTIIVEEIIA